MRTDTKVPPLPILQVHMLSIDQLKYLQPGGGSMLRSWQPVAALALVSASWLASPAPAS